MIFNLTFREMILNGVVIGMLVWELGLMGWFNVYLGDGVCVIFID